MGFFQNTLKMKVRSGYQFQDAYQMVSWVYACVNCIADAISGVPLLFFTKGKKGERIPLPEEHEVYKIFNPPLELEIPSLQEYIRTIYINLGIFGEIFSVPETNGVSKKITDLSLQPAGAFLPEISKQTGKIIGWRYNPKAAGRQYGDTREVVLKPGQVIQFKYYNPYVKYRGLSPLMAGRLAIEQETNMSIWNAGFFEGGGIRNPIAILLRRTFGGDKARQDYLESLRKNFQGYTAGQGPFVVEGGADVRPLLNSLKDLDFPEGKQLTREDICSLYGVPPAMVGIMRYASYANAKEQSKLFWLNTLTPKMRNFRDTLKEGMLTYHFPGVYCDWDWDSVDALKEDPVTEATAANLMATACKTYKVDCGYDDEKIADLLDNPDIAVDPTPGMAEAADAAEDATEDDEPIETIYLRSHNLKSETKDRSLILTPAAEYLAQYAANYQRMHLNTHSAHYRKFVEQFTKELASEIKKRKTPLDITTHHALWERSVRSIIQRAFVAGVIQTKAELINPMDALASFLHHPIDEKTALASIEGENPTSIVDFFCKRSAKSADLVVSGINGLASSGDVLEKVGETLPQLFITDGDIVSLMGTVYHHGRIVMHMHNGVIKHRWACHECRVPGHKELHGEERLVGKDFSAAAGSHPGSNEQAGCTCTTFPSEVSLIAGEND